MPVPQLCIPASLDVFLGGREARQQAAKASWKAATTKWNSSPSLLISVIVMMRIIFLFNDRSRAIIRI